MKGESSETVEVKYYSCSKITEVIYLWLTRNGHVGGSRTTKVIFMYS